MHRAQRVVVLQLRVLWNTARPWPTSTKAKSIVSARDRGRATHLTTCFASSAGRSCRPVGRQTRCRLTTGQHAASCGFELPVPGGECFFGGRHSLQNTTPKQLQLQKIVATIDCMRKVPKIPSPLPSRRLHQLQAAPADAAGGQHYDRSRRQGRPEDDRSTRCSRRSLQLGPVRPGDLLGRDGDGCVDPDAQPASP